MVEISDRQTAGVLSKKKRGAMTARALNMAGDANSGLAVNENGQLVRNQNNSKILPSGLRSSFGGQRQTGSQKLKSSFGGRSNNKKDDTGSILGSLRHKARQNMPAPLARAEASAMGALAAPVSMATSEALKQSWLNIIFVWPLIYINAHVLMSLIAGSEFFCKLGHEWLPKTTGLSLAGAGDSNIIERLSDSAGDKIGILEIMLLVLVDLLALFLVLAIITVIAFCVEAIEHPVTTFGKILGSIFHP